MRLIQWNPHSGRLCGFTIKTLYNICRCAYNSAMYYEIVQQLGQEYGMAKQAAAAGIEARRILDSIDLVKSAAVRDAGFMAQVAELSKIASYGELAMEYMEKVAANKLFEKSKSKYVSAKQALDRLKNKGASPEAIAAAEQNLDRATKEFELFKKYPNMGAKEFRERAKALEPFNKAVRESRKGFNHSDPDVLNQRRQFAGKVDAEGALLNATKGEDGSVKVDRGATAKDIRRAENIANALQNNKSSLDGSIGGGRVNVGPNEEVRNLFKQTGDRANSMLDYALKKFNGGNMSGKVFPNGVPTKLTNPDGTVNTQNLLQIDNIRRGKMPNKGMAKLVRKAVQSGELPTPGPGGNAMADAAKQVAEQVADNYGELPALSGQIADEAAKAQAAREAITKYNPVGWSTGKAVERSLNTPAATAATAAKKFGKGKLGLLAGLVGLGGAGTYYALNNDDESNPLMAPNAAAAAATAFGGDGGNEWIKGVPNWATALGGLGLAGAGAYGLSRAFSSDDDEEEKRKRRAM